MSQHIGVKIIDEKHDVKRETDLNLVDLVYYISKNSNPKIVLMSLIDEYDNTIFNQRQCLFAAEELKSTVNSEAFVNLRQDIEKLIEILENVKVHEYVLFEGD